MTGYEAVNYFNTRVKEGDTTATFVITVPNWSGLASQYTRTLAMPKLMNFTTTSTRTIPMEFYFWMEYDKPTYPFSMVTDSPQGNKAQNIGQKLKDHFGAFQKTLPLFKDLPNMYYNEDDRGNPFFELYLPARSGFYTSNELLFKGLRMHTTSGFIEAKRFIGAKGRQPQSRNVWGFFNGDKTAKTYRGLKVLPGQSLNDILGVDSVLPKNVQCQIEMVTTTRQMMPGMKGEPVAQPATLSNVMRVWDHQFDMLSQWLGLASNLFDVSTDGKVIFISNTAFENAGVRVIVEFNVDLVQAVGMNPGQRLIFKLDKERVFEMKLKTLHDDPFFESYPVMIVANCFNNVLSWVDGLGDVSIFGIIDEKTSRHPIISTGIVLSTNKTHLTVEFFDKHRRPIQFKEGHNLGMLMYFKSL